MAHVRPLSIAMIGLRGLPAQFGGVERHVEELGARLVDRGHDVTVFCRRNYSESPVPTHHRGIRLVPVPTIPTKHLEAFVHSGLSSLRTLTTDHDIVHFHALGPGLFTPLPRYLSGSAVVQTIHGMDNERSKWGRSAQSVLGLGAWLSARVPDATITVSRTLTDRYAAAQGQASTYIPNGAPDVRLRAPDQIVERFGLRGDDYVLWVGRLVPEKATDQLIRAFRNVRTDSKLVIVGGCTFTDEYSAEVKALADQDPRVVLADWQYGTVLEELFSNAALYVQPSLVEGLPLTLLEAAAFRRPVVASDIGPHVEVLGTPGPGRRLVPVNDETALAHAVQHELSHLEDAAAGAESLHAQVRSEYDWEDVADRTVEVYERVAAGRRMRRQRSAALDAGTPGAGDAALTA